MTTRTAISALTFAAEPPPSVDEEPTRALPFRVTSYHAVPAWRFIVMSFLTFNLYPFYWSFRCWRGIQARGERRVFPLLFALLYPITSFALISELNRRSSRELETPGRISLWLAAGHLALFLVGYAPTPLAYATFGQWFILVPVLRRMRALTAEEDQRRLDELGLRHTLLFTVYGLPAFVILLGYLFG